MDTDSRRGIERNAFVCAVLALLIGLSVALAVADAQSHPDFLGRWVLVGSSGDSFDLARTLVVQAAPADADPSRRALPPNLGALSVGREIDGVVHTTTLRVGLVGGVVGGVPAGVYDRPAMQSVWSVRWVDDCLVSSAETTSGTDEAGRPNTHAVTERWCMNAARQVVVTIRRTQSGTEPRHATRVYSRQ